MPTTDQHDREHATILVLELHEGAELGEGIAGRQRVRVVDDEHGVTTVLAHDRELLVDLPHQGLALARRPFDAELTREARK